MVSVRGKRGGQPRVTKLRPSVGLITERKLCRFARVNQWFHWVKQKGGHRRVSSLRPRVGLGMKREFYGFAKENQWFQWVEYEEDNEESPS